jgi:hypothetical protein
VGQKKLSFIISKKILIKDFDLNLRTTIVVKQILILKQDDLTVEIKMKTNN